MRGIDGPVRGSDPPVYLPKMLSIATVPPTALVVGARAGLLRNGQTIGPQLA